MALVTDGSFRPEKTTVIRASFLGEEDIHLHIDYMTEEGRGLVLAMKMASEDWPDGVGMDRRQAGEVAAYLLDFAKTGKLEE